LRRPREAVRGERRKAVRIPKNSLPRQTAPEQAEAAKTRRVPRISQLMALAVRMEGLLRAGTVKDYAELARLGGVSRARITQILNLRSLAPTIQEQILFLPSAASGVMSERALRRVAQCVDWQQQVGMFEELSTMCSGKVVETETPPREAPAAQSPDR
jgi:hypothetical protein